jgi:hypothetical protein
MTTATQLKRTSAARRIGALIGSTVLIGLCSATPVGTTPHDNDNSAVLEWNAYALQAGAGISQGPLPQMRSMAIVHVAMNDAVQAFRRDDRTYLPTADPPDEASVEAAAIAAAHLTLTALYPTLDFDDEFADSLASRNLDVPIWRGVRQDVSATRPALDRRRVHCAVSIHRAGRGHARCLGGQQSDVRRAARMGRCGSVGAAERMAVQARPAALTRQPAVHA